ncbi:LapA family protein [Fulvivirga maritima]|uniref:LapA family protein n=1 Tax=Fulvivirga maritima TaxID=2904247 RepID=UPI001F30AAB0|nr:LapA family protein [Fulvivirga maritima]UII28043.1 LapA family protein [Fulvivirga maritima]
MNVDLKELWNNADEALLSPDFDRLESQSEGVLRSISKVLKIEFWINLLFSPLVIVWLAISEMWWLALLQLVFSAGYFFYYKMLINKTSGFDYSQNVLQGLKATYRYLHVFLLHYKILMWLIFPVIGSIAFMRGVHVGYTQAGGVDFWFNYKIWLVILGALLVAALVSWLINWLVNLLYGHKIKRLKQQIKDFENNSGDL